MILNTVKALKAVVLAAGQGQRLRPLTFTRPKHMIPVGGKPLLEHHLKALKDCGIKEVLLVVGYKSDHIKKYFEDGSQLGMKIEYLHQKKIMGTADAFRLAEDHVDGDFLATYGDLLVSSKIVKSALNMHSKENPAATLTTVEVNNPERYGVIELDGNNVVGIIEKPNRRTVRSRQINAGIYVFSPEIFKAIKQTGISQRGEREITDSIKMLIKSGEKVIATRILSEEWLDVGRPWDLLEANIRVLNKLESSIAGTIEDGAHVEGTVYIGKGAMIRSGTYIKGPVYVGEESSIGPNSCIKPYSSIGRRVNIDSGVEVKNSILMDGVNVGHGSYISDSIVGEGCDFGTGTIVANRRLDEKTVKMRIKDKMVDTNLEKMGIVVGDRVKTGVGVLFMPGVKVGYNSWIGPNIVVYRDVSPNTFIILKQKIQQASFRIEDEER